MGRSVRVARNCSSVGRRHGTALNYAIFNEPVKFLATISGEQQVLLASTAETVQQYVDAGYTLQMSGVGNFIAFEIAVFTAQCINFPLQRNITFRSKGNPVVQAIWYFIGWLAISVALNALWGIMNPLMLWWNWPDPVIQLLKTVITGGISMIIFFFIFLIIFPDANKVAKKARAKADAAKESGNAEAAAAAELNAVRKEEDAKLTNARQARYKAISQANSRAVAFGSVVKNAEKAKAEAEELARSGKRRGFDAEGGRGKGRRLRRSRRAYPTISRRRATPSRQSTRQSRHTRLRSRKSKLHVRRAAKTFPKSHNRIRRRIL